jgi:hypothetical protein
VSLTDGGTRERIVAQTIKADEGGRFTFVVHDGLTYAVRASYPIPNGPPYRQLEVRTPPFTASSELMPVQMVLGPVVQP